MCFGPRGIRRGAGVDSFGKAILVASKNGKVAIVAYLKAETTREAPYYRVNNQITVQSVRATPNCSEALLDMMASRAVDAASLVTHSFSLDEVKGDFDTFTEQRGGAVKVVIHPNNEEAV